MKFLRIASLLFVTVLAEHARPPASAQEAVAEPAPSTYGEEYILMRASELFFETLPFQPDGSIEFGTASAKIRAEAIRFKVRAEAVGAHPAVVRAFEDFVSLLDRQSAYLKETDQIHNQAFDQAIKNGMDSGLKSGAIGAQTYSVLSQSENLTNKQAIGAAVALGSISLIVDVWSKSRDLSAQEKAGMEERSRYLGDQITATLERTRQNFQELAVLRGWKQDEVGWDFFRESWDLPTGLNEQERLAKLLEKAKRQHLARPADPFACQAHNLLRAYMANTPAELDRISEECEANFRDFPDDSVYLEFRLGALLAAGVLSNTARIEERRQGGQAGSTAATRRSLTTWRRAIELFPSDPDGNMRRGLAIARSLDGDVFIAPAEIQEMAALLKNDPRACYDFAWLLSEAGEIEASLASLESALRAGMTTPSFARADPMLAAVRSVSPEKFDRLTKPRWTCEVKSGTVFADVVFTNHSPFPLTGVTVLPDLPEWRVDLQAEMIGPGETKTWSWLPKPPKSKKFAFSLWCPENQ